MEGQGSVIGQEENRGFAIGGERERVEEQSAVIRREIDRFSVTEQTSGQNVERSSAIRQRNSLSQSSDHSIRSTKDVMTATGFTLSRSDEDLLGADSAYYQDLIPPYKQLPEFLSSTTSTHHSVWPLSKPQQNDDDGPRSFREFSDDDEEEGHQGDYQQGMQAYYSTSVLEGSQPADWYRGRSYSTGCIPSSTAASPSLELRSAVPGTASRVRVPGGDAGIGTGGRGAGGGMG